MFDFERLDVYQHVKELNIKVLVFLHQHPDLDPYLHEEWRRASLSVVTKLADGTGKMSGPEKRTALTAARGCVFESVAILEALKGMGMLDEAAYKEFYDGYEKASKMLLGMLRSYNNKDT
jgi:four helix bundle protein